MRCFISGELLSWVVAQYEVFYPRKDDVWREDILADGRNCLRDRIPNEQWSELHHTAIVFLEKVDFF